MAAVTQRRSKSQILPLATLRFAGQEVVYLALSEKDGTCLMIMLASEY
jgi:hypothetical protein